MKMVSLLLIGAASLVQNGRTWRQIARPQITHGQLVTSLRQSVLGASNAVRLMSCVSALCIVACTQDTSSDLRVDQAESIAAAPGGETNFQATNLQLPTPNTDTAAPNMIIRTGAAQITVDSLEPAVDAVRRIAQGIGGFVVSSVVTGGDRSRRSAEVVFRFPSTRFDEAVASLRPLGDLESMRVASEDVGEEYVDLQAQLRNRRMLEERLLQLLATRAGTLEEVLSVERELARVREEIDRREGRLRYLRNQVAMSTLTVYLHEPEPLISSYRGQNVIALAFRSAWRNFVLVVTGFIASLGALIPLAFVVWLLWLVGRRYRRRKNIPA